MSDNSLTIELNGQTYQATGDLSLIKTSDAVTPPSEPAPDKPKPDARPDPETGITDAGNDDTLHPHKITVRVGDSANFENVVDGQQVYTAGEPGVIGDLSSWGRKIEAVSVGKAKVYCYSDDGSRTMEVTVLPASDEFAPKHYAPDYVKAKKPGETDDGTDEKEKGDEGSGHPPKSGDPDKSADKKAGEDEVAKPGTYFLRDYKETGEPGEWPLRTVLNKKAQGEDIAVTSTMNDEVKISVVAKAGERVRILTEDGRLTPGTLRNYGDGVGVIENITAGLMGDMKLTDLEYKVGDAVVYDEDITIWTYARTRPFWNGAMPQVKPDWFKDSRFPAVSEDGASAVSTSDPDSIREDPMNKGPIDDNMGHTGEHDEIGPWMAYDARAVANPTEHNIDVMLAVHDGGAVWGYHAIDPRTNKMLRVEDYPRASMLWAMRKDSRNVLAYAHTDSPLKLDFAHFPAFGFAAGVATDHEFYKEEAEFGMNWNIRLFQNPGYVVPKETGVNSYTRPLQVRGFAWGHCHAAHAAALGGEFAKYSRDKATAMYETILDYAEKHPDRIPVSPHIHYGPHKVNTSGWQEDYNVMSLGLGAQNGIPKAQEAIEYAGQFQIQRLLYEPINVATRYSFQAIFDGEIVSSWQDAMDKAAEAAKGKDAGKWQWDEILAMPEDSAELAKALGKQTNEGIKAGEFCNIPKGATGYAAILQAATAMCAQQGLEGGDKAWARHQAHVTANYASNPKYALVPKKAA